MATRNVMTATFGQSRRRHDNLSATIDFSISLSIYQFPNSALKLRSSLCAFCIIPPSLFFFFCCAIGVGSASWGFICYASLRGRSAFIVPPPRPRWLHLWKGLQAVDKQIALLTDWLSVCLSFFTICMICQGAPHCALLWIAECVKIAVHIAHQQNLRCSAIFPVSQLSFPLFRLNWLSCGSKVLHQDKNQQQQQQNQLASGRFSFAFFLFSCIVFFRIVWSFPNLLSINCLISA